MKLRKSSTRNALFVGTMLALLVALPVSAGFTASGTVSNGVPLAPAARCDWTGQVYDDFYEPPALGDLTSDRLGEIMRVEHIYSYTPQQVSEAAGLEQSHYGAEAYRILYLSQEPMGTPRAISGLIVVPSGGDPGETFPVIVDGHPASGVADSCAPSRSPLRPRALLPYVAEGYIVTATDYLGLGTPGPHLFGVGELEGRSMLDGARAALGFCDTAHGVAQSAVNHMILEGHSQGGHAALFAHEIWPTYAPELDIKGTIAFDPGSEPRFIAETMATGDASLLVLPAVLSMYSMSQYYGAPSDTASWLLEPFASELPQRIDSQCLAGLTLWLKWRPENVFRADLLQPLAEGRWEDLRPWTGYLDSSTPGNFGSSMPVLVIQGEKDPIVPEQASVKLQQRLCAHGTSTRLSVYPDGYHNGPLFAMPEALAWASDLLSGRSPEGVCYLPRSSFLPLVAR